MNATFYANLPKAYESIEQLLNGFRDRFQDKEFLSLCDKRGNYILEPPAITRRENSFLSRATYLLGKGYVMKLYSSQVVACLKGDFELALNSTQVYVEETNVTVLRKYGFTQENGFWVPEHKVIGVHLIDGRIRVNPTGHGVTLTEDLTKDGQYNVVDITPEIFETLTNKETIQQEYQRHREALLELYHNPAIRPTVRRHGLPNNPEESIRRMILIRIKNNVGELVIADLDNLVFDEVNIPQQQEFLGHH